MKKHNQSWVIWEKISQPEQGQERKAGVDNSHQILAKENQLGVMTQ